MKWKRSRKAKEQVTQAEVEKQRVASKVPEKLLPGEAREEEDEEEESCGDECKKHRASVPFLHRDADTFSFSSDPSGSEEEEEVENATHRERNVLLWAGVVEPQKKDSESFQELALD